MNNQKTPAPPAYAAYLAIDWADQKHEFSLQVAGQTKTETGTLENKPEILGPWLAQLRQRFGGQTLAIAVEQSRGALIHLLLTYDFVVVYPIHPTTVAKFREAFKFSGAKDDPLDTRLILEILTKHLDLLRPLKPDTEATRLLARLVEDRRTAVDHRTSHLQAAQASLKEYFPQALEVLNDNLTSRLAYDLLQKWPTVDALQKVKPATFKRFLYGHNVRSPEAIEAALSVIQKAVPLTTDGAIVESGRRLTLMHLELIQALNPTIEDYDQRIAQVFDNHPEAPLFKGLPGAGPALAPRLLACFGTDRSRFESAAALCSFSGIAPVTRRSGKTKVVYFRHACPKFFRQSFHEFASHSIHRCRWARNYVEYCQAKDKDKKYNTIIRALAFKWIRILFQCWKQCQPYNEDQYMETLRKKGSIFGAQEPQKNS